MLRYAILFTMALVMLFSASLVFAHSGGKAKAFFAQKPPELDGKVDEEFEKHWDEYQKADMHMDVERVPDWFLFEETSPNRVSRGTIDDADDLSNNFGFLFDEERLYYVGVVKDANLPTDINSGEAKNKGGPTAPNTSELWLEFDFEHNACRQPKGNDDRDLAQVDCCKPQPGDHWWRIKPWTGGGTSEPACWWNHGQNAVLGDRHVFDEDCSENSAATQTGDGMIMEVHLNYKEGMKISTIAPQEFTDGVVVGFDSTMNDHEEAGASREGSISWASSFENDNCVCIYGDLQMIGVRAVSPKDKLPQTWGNIKLNARQGL